MLKLTKISELPPFVVIYAGKYIKCILHIRQYFLVFLPFVHTCRRLILEYSLTLALSTNRNSFTTNALIEMRTEVKQKVTNASTGKLQKKVRILS